MRRKLIVLLKLGVDKSRAFILLTFSTGRLTTFYNKAYYVLVLALPLMPGLPTSLVKIIPGCL